MLLVRATYIWVLFHVHIPFVVNHIFSATLAERLQQKQLTCKNWSDISHKSAILFYSFSVLPK